MNKIDIKAIARIDMDSFYKAIWAYKNSPASPDNDAGVLLKQAYLNLIKLEYERIIQELNHALEWGQLHPSMWDRELEDDEDN